MKTKNWSRLDQVALDIEYLLISVVQGVALAALAGAAVKPFEALDWQYLPYAITAFLVILIFWSGAIIHALSFIDWPLDLTHNFLYFLASFVEVMAFTHIQSPMMWFLFILFFQLVSAILYRYDLTLIKQHEIKFSSSEKKQALYLHTVHQQEKELQTFVPLAILYSAVAIVCLWLYPGIFLEKGYHVIFILGQLLFSFIFLKNSIASFKTRSHLINQAESHSLL